MIDRNSQFMAILTNVGAAKLANANALGIPWNLTALGVGDANGTDPLPSASQTKLINEQRRAPLNQLRVDPVNAAVIIAEQVIPADVGGWWIREIGLYDSDGDLVAVSNCAPSFKPALDQGSGRTQIVRMNFIVSSISNIVLKIDPAIVLATREYVDLAITEAFNKQDFKHSVLVATTANIALNGIQTIDGVLLAADARVLVKDQAQAKDNGIYIVPANGAWKRAEDADASVEVTPGLFVHVEKGTANGDSVWQLVTDAPIVLGTTALAFEVVAGRTGIVAGTYRSLTVDKLGRVIAGTNPTTLAGYGIADAYKRTDVDFLLSSKANSATTLAGYGITDARSLTNGDFAGPLFARGSVLVPQLQGVTFWSSDFGSVQYRTNHDASGWTFVTQPQAGGSIISILVDRNTGQVLLPVRPTFAGNTPWDSGNRPKSTALLATSGWRKDADTGEIVQWFEYLQGDVPGTATINVSWPFQFPNQFLNVRFTFKMPNSTTPCATQASYSGGTISGCTVRLEEWGNAAQAGLVLVIEARGN